MKYIVSMEQKDGFGDMNVKEFDTREEAIDMAEYAWSHKTASEQKRDKITVIESVNPDEDAENHFDGDIVKEWV